MKFLKSISLNYYAAKGFGNCEFDGLHRLVDYLDDRPIAGGERLDNVRGDWHDHALYGCQLHLAPPTDQSGGQKVYSIIIPVGGDRHVIEVAQGPAGT
jgi:hypothetical protein